MSEEMPCRRCGYVEPGRSHGVDDFYGMNREAELQRRTVRRGPRLAVVPSIEEVDGKPVEVWRPAAPDSV